MELQYTLLADGSSDRALIPILTWVIRTHLPRAAINSAWADLGRMLRPPKTLKDRILASIRLYPCDILFVHRDSEAEPPATRLAEINAAINQARNQLTVPRHICVVPVRMSEAWLLIDEHAIRCAAGNENGRQDLGLPPLDTLESLPNPKSVLYDALRQASGLGRRRLKQFSPAESTHLISQVLRDFSLLRDLNAFRRLENDIVDLMRASNWMA